MNHIALLFKQAVLAILSSSVAHAACTSPAADAGAREYFTATKNYRLCDGTNWIDFNTNGTVGTCTAGEEANLDYDLVNNYYRWCNGTNWIRAERPACIFTSSSLTVSASGSVSNGTYLDGVKGLQFSADRTRLYTAAWNRISSWDATTRPLAPTFVAASAAPAHTDFQYLSGLIRIGAWLYTPGQTAKGVMAVNVSGATPTYSTAHKVVAPSSQMQGITDLIASEDGNYIYTASYDSGGVNRCFFHVISVSGSTMSIVGTLDPGASYRWCNQLGLGKNNHVYMATAAGLVTINVTNKASPVVSDTAYVADAYQANALAVTPDGNFAYTVSQGGSKFCTFPTSDPTNLGTPTCMTNATAFNDSYVAQFAGRYVLNANSGGNSFTVTDVNNRTSPVVIDTASSATYLATANYFAVDGRYAYVGTEVGTRVSIVDMGCDPEIQPVTLGSCTSGEIGAQEYFAAEKALGVCNGSSWQAIAQ